MPDIKLRRDLPIDELNDEPVEELNGKLSDRPIDLRADVLSDVLADTPVDLLRNKLSDLRSDVLNDKPENRPSDLLFDKLADIPANKLNGLLGDKPADEPLEIRTHIPTPGRPPGVEITRNMSVLATSAYVRMRTARKELCMAVKSIRKGLNRDTLALRGRAFSPGRDRSLLLSSRWSLEKSGRVRKRLLSWAFGREPWPEPWLMS
ncbi:MAG TPA: hypothetical protein VMH22_07700 [bacterium]|nr:hypothetical protein [bacterium]